MRRVLALALVALLAGVTGQGLQAAAPSDRAAGDRPFDPVASIREAADHFDAKDFDGAIEAATRVIVSPSAEGKLVGLALFTRGSAYFQNGDFASAIVDYGEALTYEAPKAGMVHLYRAMAFESTGDLESAAKDYSAALVALPNDPWVNLHAWRFFNEP